MASGLKPEFNQTVYDYQASDKWRFLETSNPADSPGFMLRSPAPVIICTLSYLAFVCVVGPLIMRNRKPLELKSVIRLYNLLMVFLAVALAERIFDAVGSMGSLVDCSKTFTLADRSATKVYQMADFILAVRISEYFDTIFFTLRKKHNQVTFLHVFHHTFVPLYAFWILKTAPLRFNVYIILINSSIHILMYFYYFLATFQQPRDGQTKNPPTTTTMTIINKLLKFKKYMTQLQILQFVSLALYTLWAAVQPNMCNVPKTYILSNFLLAAGFLGMFSHFYLTVYKGAPRDRTTAEVKTRRD